MQAVEEGTGVVEVLDDLAGDHHVGRREPEGAHRLDVAAVDRVRLVAAARARSTPASSRSRPIRSPAAVARCSCNHAPDCRLQLLAAGVGEPDVHHAAAAAALAQVLEPVDQRGRREGVHHLELGVLGHGVAPRAASSRSTGGSSVERRSPGAVPPGRERGLDAGEGPAAVVPEQAAAQRSCFGHHPERLVGVEVVGVAVRPEHPAGARDPAGGPARRLGQRPEVDATQVREPDAADADDRARQLDETVGPPERCGGQARVAEQRVARREHARRVREAGLAEHVERPARPGHEREDRRPEPEDRAAG